MGGGIDPAQLREVFLNAAGAESRAARVRPADTDP
jgi:hypothetical protein